MKTLEWTPEELRRFGYMAVDALVEQEMKLRDLPVRRMAARGELEAEFDRAPSEQGRPFEEVLQQVVERLLPNTMRVNHPRFFGFVPGPSNPVSVLAEMLAAGFNVFAGTWMGGAGATVVERRLVRWLAEEIGMPGRAGGVMVSGGSMANLTALLVARERHPFGRSPNAAVYFSDQTHSASERALRALGYAETQWRRIECDEMGRLPPAALHEAIDKDLQEGRAPFCVVANAGTTGTGAVDPFPELARLCSERRMWLHADAAYGGAAAICARGRIELAGLEACDSLALDPHKWLFQPFDLGCVLVREEDWLTETFRIIPAYMNDVYRLEHEINFCDRGLELTRPFRALKLWMSLEHFGVEAFREAVERGFALAEFAECVLRTREGWEVVTPAQMGIVTFRRAGDDELQRLLVDALLADGYAMLSSTTVKGRPVLRLCPINPRTREEEIEGTIARLEELAGRSPSRA